MALGDNGRPTVVQLAERYAVESDIIGRTPQKGLPAFAFPGGYPFVYEDEYRNDLCPDCASELVRELARYEHDENERDMVTRVVDWQIYDEGPTIFCEQCNAELESAYGDPFEDKAETLNVMSWQTVMQLSLRSIAPLREHKARHNMDN